jgi:hypothetical protein
MKQTDSLDELQHRQRYDALLRTALVVRILTSAETVDIVLRTFVPTFAVQELQRLVEAEEVDAGQMLR